MKELNCSTVPTSGTLSWPLHLDANPTPLLKIHLPERHPDMTTHLHHGTAPLVRKSAVTGHDTQSEESPHDRRQR